jgi:integrase
MAVYKRGDVWWYKFRFAGRFIRESAKTASKTVAKEAERQRRRDLEEGYNNIVEVRDERVRPLKEAAASYLREYKLRNPRSAVFAEYAIDHVIEQIGHMMLVDVNDKTVKEYQFARLKEGASPKTINEEVGFLLRLLGNKGDALRSRLRREKSLKLKVRQNAGKAYSHGQKQALLQAAQVQSMQSGFKKRSRARHGTRSPFILPALTLAFNAGLRHSEIRHLTWSQIDFEKRFLTVGKSKSEAGEGRTIPLNDSLLAVLVEYARWYTKRFGTAKPEWFVFPGRVGKPENGKRRPYDPTRPISTLKTAWKNVKNKVGVNGRFHDTRHTLVTELAESGAGDQTIMDIAGHVSRQMLARYSHIRMEAKRKALKAIEAKPQRTDPEPKDENADPEDSEVQ